jgi:hypothetical protein
METQTTKTKSFWARPEGITGMLFIAAGLVGFYYLLPYLITFVENTLYLAGMCAFAGLVSWLIIANKEALWYLFKSLSFGFTKLTIGWAIAIDSVSIAKVYIASLRKKKDNVEGQIDKLGGAIKKLNSDIAENNKGIKTSLAEAEQARKLGEKGDTKYQMTALKLAKEANYMKQSNDELVPVVNSMGVMFDILKKVYDVSEFIIDDKEKEISIMEKKYKAINIGLSALRSAQSIIGYDEKKGIYEQYMETMKDDMANKLSEMDKIINMANPLINRMDLKESVNTEEANKLLAQFSTGEFEKIISNLQAKPNSPVMLDAKSSNVETKKENAYSELLN